MAVAERVYKVQQGETVRLVKAVNKTQALNYVARATITAEVASQADLIELLPTGIMVEDAKAEPADQADE